MHGGCRPSCHLACDTQQAQETAQTNSIMLTSVHSPKRDGVPRSCVFSRERVPGRNGTTWVRMRSCPHKCNRTQVRPATNENEHSSQNFVKMSGVGDSDTTQISLREERLKKMKKMGTEDSALDVRHGRPDVQLEPERAERFPVTASCKGTAGL